MFIIFSPSLFSEFISLFSVQESPSVACVIGPGTPKRLQELFCHLSFSEVWKVFACDVNPK